MGPSHVDNLFSAFANYWGTAQNFHKQVYDVFQGRGTLDQLKKNLMLQDVAAQTKRNVDWLVLALEQAARSEQSTFEEASFFRTLKRMLSRPCGDWGDLQAILHCKKKATTPQTELSDVKVAFQGRLQPAHIFQSLYEEFSLYTELYRWLPLAQA